MKRYTPLSHFDVDQVIINNAGHQCIPAFPILSLLQGNQALKFISAVFQDAPPSNTIYDLITYVVSQMEYEFAFINSPIFKGGKLVSSCLKPLFYDAHPPKCNIIFGSHVNSMRTEESVSNVPTRIKTESRSAVQEILGSSNNIAAMINRINWYPVSENIGVMPIAQAVQNMQLLDNEYFTGPRVYETFSPVWMEVLQSNLTGTPDQKIASYNNYKEQVLKTMLRLKQYEYRSFNVDSAFNPYITPGFPGVVFDTMDSRISIAGHVLAVSHRITKNSASTSVDFGFTRTLEDAVNPETRIENTFSEIYDNITSQVGKMSDIYQDILGCNAVGFDELLSARNEKADFMSPTPKAAYQYNYRPICTAGEYAGFMGATIKERFWVEGYLDDRGFSIMGMIGHYFKERYNPEVVGILEKVSEEEYSNEVYSI